jgi:hypothetical protein
LLLALAGLVEHQFLLIIQSARLGVLAVFRHFLAFPQLWEQVATGET